MKILRRSCFVALALCAICVHDSVVQNSHMSGRQRVSATKFDEYKSLPTDDEAARLDAFFNELQAQPHLKGYIVAYNSADALPGPFLRRLYGDQKYLTDTRGIAPDRIIAVDGGYRNESATELWLVPTGASPPQSSDAVTEPRVVHRKAYMFDMECLECSPAVQLDLFGMDEGLRFYANELRTHATARAQIIVRPGQEVGLRQALNEAKQAKKLLVRDHGINGRRITVKAASRRKDNVAVAEMWVVSR